MSEKDTHFHFIFYLWKTNDKGWFTGLINPGRKMTHCLTKIVCFTKRAMYGRKISLFH